jgi:hypothetical protein
MIATVPSIKAFLATLDSLADDSQADGRDALRPPQAVNATTPPVTTMFNKASGSSQRHPSVIRRS